MTKSRTMELIRNWCLLVEFDIPDSYIEMLASLLAEESQKRDVFHELTESMVEGKWTISPEKKS